MSWFSKHILNPVEDFFKGPDLSGVTAALNAQTAATTDASNRALQLQKDELAASTAAATPVQDSESARQAGEDRMRKLMATTAPPMTGTAALGGPPIGYRILTGN